MRRGRSSERAIRSVPTDASRGRSSATTGTPVGGGDIGTGGACETGGTGGGGGGAAVAGVKATGGGAASPPTGATAGVGKVARGGAAAAASAGSGAGPSRISGTILLSQAGMYQFVLPSRRMVAGTIITRTIVESIRTPIARPRPN